MARHWREHAGTLTNNLVSLGADFQRCGLVVGNPSDTVMTLRVGGDATAAIGIPIPAGGSLALVDDHVPRDEVTLFCAGSAKAYTIYEW